MVVVVQHTEAAPSAEQWLDLIDKGQYAQGWHKASELVHEKVTLDEWRDAIESVRVKLGVLRSRELIAEQEYDVLPDVPEGEYLILQYSTQFASKSDVTETVTLAKENAQWRVAGYFIK